MSIDLSLRSTGIVAVDRGGLVDFKVIVSSPKELNDEDLLIYNADQILDFIYSQISDKQFTVKGIVIEGLSFGGVSGSKDILQGNFWNIRTGIRKAFPSTPVGVVPVTSWRSKVLSKEEQKVAKSKVKDGLKEACYAKLPKDVKSAFVDYLEINKEVINKAKVKDWKLGSKSSEYLKCRFDLCDAYWLSQYRLSLENKS